jgi:hypothetical protein
MEGLRAGGLEGWRAGGIEASRAAAEIQGGGEAGRGRRQRGFKGCQRGRKGEAAKMGKVNQ